MISRTFQTAYVLCKSRQKLATLKLTGCGREPGAEEDIIQQIVCFRALKKKYFCPTDLLESLCSSDAYLCYKVIEEKVKRAIDSASFITFYHTMPLSSGVYSR